LWPLFFNRRAKKAILVLAVSVLISTISGLQVPLGIAETRVPNQQQPVELAYDDGEAEIGWLEKSPGGYDAVHFSAPFESFQVLLVKYYIWDPASFSVLILDANRRSVYEKPATPVTDKAQWFEVDLSKENVFLDGDFYAALKWTTSKKPSLGADETNPDGRSFFVGTDGRWQTYVEMKKAVKKKSKDGDFMIRVTVAPLIQMTLQVEPNITGITVDGAPQSAKSLPKTFTWLAGSAHTLLVDSTISSASGVRYVFVEWSDGSKDASRTANATEATRLTAKFKIQYELKVIANLGDPQGSGWYDAGSTATFSVTSPQPQGGLFGSLGGKIVFQAWTGDSAAETATASIGMDGPKAVEAQWTTDESQPYMILGGIGAAIVAAIILAFILIRRRLGAAPPPPPIIPRYTTVPPPQPAVLQPPLCPNCGSATTYAEEYQRYYCYNCQRWV